MPFLVAPLPLTFDFQQYKRPARATHHRSRGAFYSLLLLLLLNVFFPLVPMAQTTVLEPLFDWQLETNTGQVSKFTVSFDPTQKCILHFSRLDVIKGNRQLQMHRTADLRYFAAVAERDGNRRTFTLVLDIEQQNIQGNTLSLSKDRNRADEPVERRFLSWKIQSEIREGYRRINAVWPELGRKYANLPREEKVQLIAHDLAAMNQRAAFGAFFQHNYREGYIMFGQKAYRFLPAQGFALRVGDAEKSQKLTDLLRTHRSAFCRN